MTLTSRLLLKWFALVSSISPLVAQPLIYTTSGKGGSMLAIDSVSGKIVANVPLNVDSDARGIAISPDGKRVYVADGATLAVVDATDYSVRHVDFGPVHHSGTFADGVTSVVVSPDGGRVFVTYTKPDSTAQTVIVSTATLESVGVLPAAAARLGVTPDGMQVLGYDDAGSIAIFDVRTGKRFASYQIPGEVYAQLSPDGRRIVVSKSDFDDPQSFESLQVFDVATGMLLSRVDLDVYVDYFRLSPDGTRAYLVNHWDEIIEGRIDVVDLQTGKKLTSIQCRARGLTFSSDGRSVFALSPAFVGPFQNPAVGSVAITSIDTATNTIAGAATVATQTPYLGLEFMAVRPTPPTLNAPTLLDGAALRQNIARGSFASVFGLGLAHGMQSAFLPWPISLLDTVVTFNGIPGPLAFVSPNQVNLQVPWELPTGSVTMQVNRNGLVSESRTVTIDDIAPAIFTIDAGGAGAITHNAGFEVVTPQSPARAGETINIFATGLGPVNRPVPTGQTPNVLDETVATPQVTIGEIPAEVLFSGLSPLYPALYQINVRVAPGTPAGAAVPVVVTISGTRSNSVNTSIQ